MPPATAQRREDPETPVWMFWQISGDGQITPELNIDQGHVRQDVFDAFDAESVTAIAETMLPTHRSTDRVRLGVVRGQGPNPVFHAEPDLLTSVEGIGDELAHGLLSECGDIPTLCERRRDSGEAFLGEVLHGAEFEGKEWLGELEEFIDSFGRHDDFESRMKDAGVWVEPGPESSRL